jgi:hypothetical protein
VSDPSRNGRRIPVRVVPIARLAPQPVERQPRVEDVSGTFRLRKYGAPLARLPLARAVTRGHPTRDSGSAAPANRDGQMQEVVPDEIDERDDPGLDELIIWEQPDQEGNETSEPVPQPSAAVDEPLSEMQYAELGSYVAFLLSGFCDFCNTPAVTESGPWRARLDMPQVVLPETVLDLHVTPQEVKLRFETAHRMARDVLERHIERLQSEVRIAMGDSRVVEVVLW